MAITRAVVASGGSGWGLGVAHAEPAPIHGQSHSLALTLPPLATVIYLAGQP